MVLAKALSKLSTALSTDGRHRSYTTPQDTISFVPSPIRLAAYLLLPPHSAAIRVLTRRR